MKICLRKIQSNCMIRYNYCIFHLHSARDWNIHATEKVRMIALQHRFSMLRRITTLFHLATCTCVRLMGHSVTAITYGVTAGRVLKKADGLPSYTLLLSKHVRCRNRQRSRILRSCRPRAAECYVSKAAGHTSLSSSPGNIFRSIPFLFGFRSAGFAFFF